MRQPQQLISPTRFRRGATMVEALVTVSIGAVVLTLGVGMIHLLLRGERETRRAVEDSITLSRLSTIVRRDVHAAQSADIADEPAGGPARLTLTFPERRTVTYIADGSSLSRIENNPESSEHRDSFRFPSGTTIGLVRGGAPELVRIAIERGARSSDSHPSQYVSSPTVTRSPRVVHIDAVPARDHRYDRRNR